MCVVSILYIVLSYNNQLLRSLPKMSFNINVRSDLLFIIRPFYWFQNAVPIVLPFFVSPSSETVRTALLSHSICIEECDISCNERMETKVFNAFTNYHCTLCVSLFPFFVTLALTNENTLCKSDYIRIYSFHLIIIYINATRFTDWHASFNVLTRSSNSAWDAVKDNNSRRPLSSRIKSIK